MSKLLIFSLLFLTTFIGVVGDSFIKDAATKNRNYWNNGLVIGLIMYIAVALLWYTFAKNIKLTTVGVVYPFFSMLLYTLVGLIYFKEKINIQEFFGIGFGVVSIYLLAKYS